MRVLSKLRVKKKKKKNKKEKKRTKRTKRLGTKEKRKKVDPQETGNQMYEIPLLSSSPIKKKRVITKSCQGKTSGSDRLLYQQLSPIPFFQFQLHWFSLRTKPILSVCLWQRGPHWTTRLFKLGLFKPS